MNTPASDDAAAGAGGGSAPGGRAGVLELIPLFPLGTLVFPGGVLPLRIFEQRYLDLIKRCMRDGSGFGVVLIRQGSETLTTPGSSLPEIHLAGTYVRIVDFDQLEGGMLGVSCQGQWKFRVGGNQFERDRVMWAPVERLPEEPVTALPPESGGMVELLRQLGEMVPAGVERPPIDFDDPREVGWRLAEMLPLEPELKIELLLLDDPIERLAMLSQLIDAIQARRPS